MYVPHRHEHTTCQFQFSGEYNSNSLRRQAHRSDLAMRVIKCHHESHKQHIWRFFFFNFIICINRHVHSSSSSSSSSYSLRPYLICRLRWEILWLHINWSVTMHCAFTLVCDILVLFSLSFHSVMHSIYYLFMYPTRKKNKRSIEFNMRWRKWFRGLKYSTLW